MCILTSSLSSVTFSVSEPLLSTSCVRSHLSTCRQNEKVSRDEVAKCKDNVIDCVKKGQLLA